MPDTQAALGAQRCAGVSDGAAGAGRRGDGPADREALGASSDGPDTDFTAKLVDVYPPNRDFPAGVDLNVADGIVRARYRDGLDREQSLTPGRPYEFTIEMYPTSLVFARATASGWTSRAATSRAST